MKATANPYMMRATQERRRSSAAGKHDTRPNRQRTRSNARRAAIKEQS